MQTISLCMIVKNEEEVLEGCLNSVNPICDEIIIVDTGSTDRTKEIAAKFTDKIFDFKWIDDFSAARNFSFSKASMDYILWLDADDILKEKDLLEFKKLKKGLHEAIDGVAMKYDIDFDEDGEPTFSYRRNRLVKRSKQFKWIGPVHEYLEVSGSIIPADIAITHRKSEKKLQVNSSDRNLNIYEKRLKNGEEFTPRDLYYYANELKDHGQHQKATIYYQEFLSTKKGWVEDEIRACMNMAECYKQLGDFEKEMKALTSSMNYDIPRPEVSCRLGDIYKNMNQYKKAVIWYRLAIEVEIVNDFGFTQKAYSTWYPHLQLCVVYWQLGEIEKSIEHNNLAKKFKPNDPQVLYNEKFFNDYLASRKKDKS